MLFTQLKPLLKKLDVSIRLQHVANDDNLVRAIVTVKPKRKMDDDDTVKNWAPFFITGTPEKVMNDLNSEVLIQQISGRHSYVNSVLERKDNAAAEKKEEKAAKTATKKTTAKEKEEKPKLSSDELKLVDWLKEVEDIVKKGTRGQEEGLETLKKAIALCKEEGKVSEELIKRTVAVKDQWKAMPVQTEIL